MKKNILLVQSFLLLPLMSSSLSFSMDQNERQATYAETTQKRTQLPQPLKQSGSKKRNKKKKTPAPEQQQQTTPAIATENTVNTDKKLEEREVQAITKEEMIKRHIENSITDEDKTNAKKDLELAKKNINENEHVYNLLMTIQSLSQGNGLNPVEIVTSIPETPTPVKIEDIKIHVSEHLLDSVLSPSERNELGISQRLWNSWKTNRAIAIALLTSKTFEPNNAV